jgi:hypothetical protein
MGRACSRHRRDEKFAHFSWLIRREDTTWETYKQTEDNIKMDLKKAECEDMDWIQVVLGQIPVAGSYEYGNELSGSTKGGEFLH